MAKLGFYDIRTFEILSREMENSQWLYNSIYEPETADPQNHHAKKAGTEANKRKAK
jgi:hypothetical protein